MFSSNPRKQKVNEKITISEVIMAKKFPKLIIEINTHLQKAQPQEGLIFFFLEGLIF